MPKYLCKIISPDYVATAQDYYARNGVIVETRYPSQAAATHVRLDGPRRCLTYTEVEVEVASPYREFPTKVFKVTVEVKAKKA